MGGANHMPTLGDYSRPSYEGYRNTIELLVWNNVVPLRSDTIRTAKLRNDILMFQQHQRESLSEAWTCFKDLLQKVPHRGINLWLQVQIFYDHVTPTTRRTSDQSVSAYIASMQPTQVNKITFSCEICSGPHNTQYCMENPEKDFVEYASLCTDKAGESLELGKNGSAFIQSEMPKKIEDLRLFTLPCRLGNSEPFDTLADLGACVNIIPLYLFKKLNIGLLEETNHVFRLSDGTKSYPIGIVRDIEEEDSSPTSNAVIDCRKAKIVVGEGTTRSMFGVKGIELGQEEASYWTTLEKMSHTNHHDLAQMVWVHELLTMLGRTS
nr:zinc finger, CCHC-type [Tanacetum cinerariifolium]